MLKPNPKIWKVCVIAVICIVCITFTPLITPAGKSQPFLLSLPYTLWISVLLTLILVGLTWLGGHVLPHQKEDEL